MNPDGAPVLVVFLVVLFVGQHVGLAGEPGAIDHLLGQIPRDRVIGCIEVMVGVINAIGNRLLEVGGVDPARAHF